MKNNLPIDNPLKTKPQFAEWVEQCDTHALRLMGITTLKPSCKNFGVS